MPIVTLTDFSDTRLNDYREIREGRLRSDSGKFVAEGELVVRKLMQSHLPVHSVLVTPNKTEALASFLRPNVPAYAVPQTLMDEVTGFHVHRGWLAVGARPQNAEVPATARAVVLLEDLVAVDNLGAMMRNASAFGVDAVVLSPACADPYYRKAIRVSMGNVFGLPVVRSMHWPDELPRLRERLGLELVGAVVDAKAKPLLEFKPPARFGLVLGSEGPGLTAAARAACDHLITIPMTHADSLNVAVAGAIFLHHLMRS